MVHEILEILEMAGCFSEGTGVVEFLEILEILEMGSRFACFKAYVLPDFLKWRGVHFKNS